MRVAIAVLVILGLSALLLFIGQNSSQTVPIILIQEPAQEYPVSLVVLVSLILGVLFASVIGIVEGTRLRYQNHQLRGRSKKLEAEIHTIRTAPAGKVAEENLDEESVL